MVELAHLKDLLNRMAQRFEEAEQAPDGAPDLRGWGQFLDAPKRHKQVGPYGTSAGIIVLALAERGGSALMKRAVDLLRHWWMNRDQCDYARKRITQTPRLAFFSLALRLSGIAEATNESDQVQNVLLERLLPSGMWGNFWVSDKICDSTPRGSTSAFVVLSLLLLRDTKSAIDSRITEASDELEKQLIRSKDLSLKDTSALCAAVLATKETSISRKTFTRINRVATSEHSTIDEKAVYFYTYEHSPDKDGQTRYDNGYFLVPTDILLGIAGFLPGAPTALRLRAEAAVNSLVENLSKNNGAYRPDNEQRVCTMDQAWAAILIKIASLEYKTPSISAKIWYEVRRRRSGNWFTNVGLPLLALVVATITNILVIDTGLIEKLITQVVALIIGGMYGQKVFQRLIRGIE